MPVLQHLPGQYAGITVTRNIEFSFCSSHGRSIVTVSKIDNFNIEYDQIF